MSGHDVVTITNDEGVYSNDPSEAYLDVLARGLEENYPEMSRDEIDRYLEGCMER